MSNSFCRLLSNGYKINVFQNQMVWSPCCFYSTKTPMANQERFQRALEYTSSATSWLPECNQCQRMEESGAPGLAPRLNSFKKIPYELDAGKCGALEINLDLMCNAACLSCGSYASTTWQKYEAKHQNPSYVLKQDRSTVDNFFNQLIETVDLSEVQDIFMHGGEPLYGDTHIKLLKHLHSVHKNLDRVVLSYQTNGSIIPTPEVLELWRPFKLVIMSFSIDGVGERFNYLRWPLKWHRVQRTVDFVLANTQVKLTVNATVNPLSVLYFDEIENWAYQTIPDDRRALKSYELVRPNRCMQPLDLNLTTPELRNAVVEKYGADHKLSLVFSNLEFDHKYQRMFNYIDHHDRLRRLNWRETFPEAVKYYSQYA